MRCNTLFAACGSARAQDADPFAPLAHWVGGQWVNTVRTKEGEEIRAWVLGCATGEEAYSVAILIHELAEELATYTDWHVFGTDLDKDAINFARSTRQ